MATETPTRRELAITGMTCASCVRSVETALASVVGVESAEVNLANERATVRLDPAKTELGALVHAVARATPELLDTVSTPESNRNDVTSWRL